MSEKETLKRMVVEVNEDEYFRLKSKLALSKRTVTSWTKDNIKKELIGSSELVPVAE